MQLKTTGSNWSFIVQVHLQGQAFKAKLRHPKNGYNNLNKMPFLKNCRQRGRCWILHRPFTILHPLPKLIYYKVIQEVVQDDYNFLLSPREFTPTSIVLHGPTAIPKICTEKGKTLLHFCWTYTQEYNKILRNWEKCQQKKESMILQTTDLRTINSTLCFYCFLCNFNMKLYIKRTVSR